MNSQDFLEEPISANFPRYSRSQTQKYVFISYSEELRVKKKYLDILQAQLENYLSAAQKRLNEIENNYPPMPSVFNPFDPIPHFQNNCVFLDCNHTFNSMKKLLFTPSSDEPIKPQFRIARKYNSFRERQKDMGKELSNIFKISKNDPQGEPIGKLKPAESRLSIFKSMELFERNERINSRYMPMKITADLRYNFLQLKKKSPNDARLLYSHTSKKIIPHNWPQRIGDEGHMLTVENNDMLFAAVLSVIGRKDEELMEARRMELDKKKRKNNDHRFMFPIADSSTESSGEETDSSDFI
ncbi:hypothetical protein TRFO_30519 [Tritrichomonas foetus]|uniref:Uncharacterized protein n=1 Tax=Tritrichomonas foetus TaxID=1144522 RepID=A0A1J4JVD0_9EUKA|nr:hypothetical protein TRFO_30519 [Tritrichomonas foetus]|eukprot:OHT02392.1 hypothetical protein TRFO_30519 [Tritrichomonas foetus]